MTHADPKELVARLTGNPLIVMLDIDGTLCEIVERPGDAKVPAATAESLREMHALADHGVHLAFITGRSIADARRIVDVEGAVMYGNHGMERATGSGAIREPDGWESSGPSMRAGAHEIAVVIRQFPGVRLEDKRFSLTVHYRDMDQLLFPRLCESVNAIARRRGLHATAGKKMISVVPVGAFNKGDAALEILGEIIPAADGGGASVLFAGDDVTDEDAFAALANLPSAVTVRVGDPSRPTAAKWSLPSPVEVHQLLDLILESRT